MSGEQFLFWLFALLTCGGAIAVVITQNIVRMAFWLIISLGSVSALFFLAGADFVGASQLIIYVGGTVILLIFGVMLTATGPHSITKTSPAELLLASAVGFVFLSMLMATAVSVDWKDNTLKLVDISASKFQEVRELQEHAEQHQLVHLLDDHYRFDEFRSVYRLKTEISLSSSEAEQLMKLWRKHGLKFSPSRFDGGTTRPLGMSFLGVRPDRNLVSQPNQSHESTALVSQGQQVSPGFLTPPRMTALSKKVSASRQKNQAGANIHSSNSNNAELSTGYLLPFEIVSVHLLVVLIGAAYLARAKKQVDETGEVKQ